MEADLIFFSLPKFNLKLFKLLTFKDDFLFQVKMEFASHTQKTHTAFNLNICFVHFFAPVTAPHLSGELLVYFLRTVFLQIPSTASSLIGERMLIIIFILTEKKKKIPTETYAKRNHFGLYICTYPPSPALQLSCVVPLKIQQH